MAERVVLLPQRQDLAAHERIVLAEPGSDEVWFLGQGRGSRAVPVEGRLRVASLRAGQAAARFGPGIVRLPAALVVDDLRAGLLVQVLQAETASGVPVFAVHAGGGLVPTKVRAFLDLLVERRAALPWDAPSPRARKLPCPRRGALLLPAEDPEPHRAVPRRVAEERASAWG